jgi:hypothetical protein
VGVGLATWGTTSVRFPTATEMFLFTITCRLAGTHTPSKLMREVTHFPCLKRPVPKIKMGGRCEERSGKYGSEKLETEGVGEETMERNN